MSHDFGGCCPVPSAASPAARRRRPFATIPLSRIHAVYARAGGPLRPTCRPAYAPGMPSAQPCPTCERGIDAAFRYCPWCAAPQRQKLVEFFSPHPAQEADQELALRVSRYLTPDPDERQTRISIWHQDGSALAAIGLDDEESARLARFLGTAPPPPPAPPAPPTLRDRISRHLRPAPSTRRRPD